MTLALELHETKSDEDLVNHNKLPLHYLRRGDCAPLVQDGIDSRKMFSIKRT